MGGRQVLGVLVGCLLVIGATGGVAGAQSLPGVHEGVALPSAATEGVDLLLEGWSDFGNVWLLLDMLMVLALALGLGALLAYHPAARRNVSSLDHFEQPKTFLMYAMVAAVVALIVKVQPAMALVVFGIGGLLRFRTMVGESKDTGRVILVTVVGLCCGLKIFIVAIPATLLGWIVIHFLEQQNAGTIRVSGVAEASMDEAVRAYRRAISEAGCTIIREQTKFIKREFLFVVQAPRTLQRPMLAAAFDALPQILRGVVDFEGL